MKKYKRKFFRFDCQCFGEARFGDNQLERFLVKDISCEGLRIVVHNRYLNIGSIIEIRVDVPWKKVPPLVKGEVKWISPESKSTEIGLKLSPMDNGIKTELMDYAYSVWHNNMLNRQGSLRNSSY